MRSTLPLPTSTDSYKREVPGSITVFLALIFMMIAALLLTITESARTQATRLYLQVSLDSAIESLFSQYHRPLFETYRIFGLEYRDDADLQEETLDFIKPYLNAQDLFPLSLREEDLLFQKHEHLTEGLSLEEEILDYMEFGLIDKMLHFHGEELDAVQLSAEAEDLFKRVKESDEIRELQKKYQLDAKDLQEVEDAIYDIKDCTENAAGFHGEAVRDLSHENPGSFYHHSQRFREEQDHLITLVSAYSEAADRLAEKVLALREDFTLRKDTLSPEAQAGIHAQISEYENYVNESGSIRSKIEAMPAQANTLQANALQVEQAVEEFEAWLEEALADSDDEEDEDEDYSDEIAAFYHGAAADYSAMSLNRYDGVTASINKKNKKILDRISSFLEGNMLSLVLPDGQPLPNEQPIQPEKTGFSSDTSGNPVNIAILGEYALSFFHYYHLDRTPKNSENDKDLPPSKSKALEIEYLLGGKDSDAKNLSSLVTKLVTLRETMNLLYLYTDTQKRQEAETFAVTMLLGGVAANPALVMILSFFILGIWALGQAIQDVRVLLNNGRVPFFHTSESWTLSLSGLMELGQGTAPSNETTNKKGLSYRDYLRIFLFGQGVLDQAEINNRMLLRMEKGVQTVGKDPETFFSISDCLYGVGCEAHVDTRHVMYQTAPIQVIASSPPDPTYMVTLNTYYKYRNSTQ